MLGHVILGSRRLKEERTKVSKPCCFFPLNKSCILRFHIVSFCHLAEIVCMPPTSVCVPRARDNQHVHVQSVLYNCQVFAAYFLWPSYVPGGLEMSEKQETDSLLLGKLAWLTDKSRLMYTK